MAAMRTLFVCLALAPAVLEAKKEKVGKTKPIITTDIVYGTVELFYDLYDETRGFVMEKAAPVVSPIMEQASANLPKDPIAEICSKAGVEKKMVMSKIAEAQAAVLQVKSLVAEKSALVYEPLNSVSVALITKFESALPKYAGLIPKTPGDLFLFLVYFTMVLYVIFKVVMRILRIVLGIFCCVCCCGCCRRGKTAKPAAAKGSKAAQKGKAATEGKAATASNSKSKNGKK
uniref:Uncharacterized protein n=1 Tax=Alexandrium andersonii TaxID=327968 RepID=A0A7S2CBD3_9DINO|mmetsp:Transcript_36727/g.83559  ORF Transcript_36727/g.83559 Transcript_36727/m.83559 type:complete len:231 (+) Transcript_36727:87-779(+)